MKAHIERRDRSRKVLCGVTIPADYNPWSTSLESCERCARIKQQRDNKPSAGEKKR